MRPARAALRRVSGVRAARYCCSRSETNVLTWRSNRAMDGVKFSPILEAIPDAKGNHPRSSVGRQGWQISRFCWSKYAPSGLETIKSHARYWEVAERNCRTVAFERSCISSVSQRGVVRRLYDSIIHMRPIPVPEGGRQRAVGRRV